MIVGTDETPGENFETLRVTVNGKKTTQIEDVKPENGFEWKVNTFFEPVASHISEVSPRVMQFALDDLAFANDGDNVVTIEATESIQNIKWLEVQVKN